MPPPQPSFLHGGAESSPLGWEGARFPLSRLDLENLAGISLRSSMAKREDPLRMLRRWRRESSLRGEAPEARSCGTSIRILGKNKKGWTLLKVRPANPSDLQSRAGPRRGELSPDLVKEIWGNAAEAARLDSPDCRSILLDLDMEISKVTRPFSFKPGSFPPPCSWTVVYAYVVERSVAHKTADSP
jgi:hypothetical protein